MLTRRDVNREQVLRNVNLDELAPGNKLEGD